MMPQSSKDIKTTAPKPQIGVSIAVRKGQRLLIIKRGKPPYLGYWAFAGGSVEFGEKLEEAAKRELIEETGLQSKQMRFDGFFEQIMHDRQDKATHHFILARFICDAFVGEAVAGDDASDICWITYDEIEKFSFVPGMADLIKQIFQSDQGVVTS